MRLAAIFVCLSATLPWYHPISVSAAELPPAATPVQLSTGAETAPVLLQGRLQQSRSAANIDAIIARQPTLIFQVVEEVIRDEDDLDNEQGDQDGSGPALPHGSELDTTSKNKLFKRNQAVLGGEEQSSAPSSGPRLKQAKREEISARMVAPDQLNKRNNHNNGSPSPIARASPGFNGPGKSLASPGFSSVKSTKVMICDSASDDKTVRIPTSLPFDLNLFGRTFDGSDLYISTNGYIRLGSQGHTSDEDSANPIAFPSKTLGTYMLYPYWDDLALPKSAELPYPYSISYTFTSNMVTFGWRVAPLGVDIAPSTAHLSNGMIHFQAIYRHDSPGKIEFSYLEDSDPEQLTGEFATIGMQSDKGVFRYASFKKGSIHPGLSLVLDTVTGEADIIA